MKRRLVYLVLSLLLTLPTPGYALQFNALTLFGCDKDGAQDGHARWNSGPVDACWDIFMYEGDIAQNAAQVKWMNDSQSHLVTFAPTKVVTTYTFHFECGVDIPFFGMNLFVADRKAPVLSVYAPITRDASRSVPFQVNRSGNTMGWPLSDVRAVGSASCSDVKDSLWQYDDDLGLEEFVVTDFRVLTPSAAGNRDFVEPHQVSPSGKADYIGQFTIERRSIKPAPADWLLWTGTVASMKIGANNEDGKWKQKYDYEKARPPFSFIYNGKSSHEFLNDWHFDAQHKQLDQNRIAHVLTWRDPRTQLEVRWDGLEYTDFESIEWTIYLTNHSTQTTPIIEDIRALDVHFTRSRQQEYNLRHWAGTLVKAEDFAPKSMVLSSGKQYHFAPEGRSISTSGNWPYYNLEAGDEGMIVVVGWPGRWYAKYQRDSERGLQVTAGQEIAHFKLLPSETVRSPLIVLQFWKDGDWIDAQNIWRQWMIKHNIPRRNGKRLPLPQFNACSSHQFAEMTQANEKNQIEFIDSYLAKGLNIDYWWMDAGWYVGAAEKGWTWTGTWQVDRRQQRFPNGLRTISDHGRSRGVDTIVWFEPERVAPGTWLATERADWVLPGKPWGLLNLGNPQAWEWVVNHIDAIINKEGIDLYRQDFNVDPFPYWNNNDTEDRQGITENKYVVGYLAYWDELLRRHPGMVIDSCASGGHRNDLETMRRSVPLLRSDYLFEPVGQQGHTYGLSFWLPFHGTGYCPSNTAGWGWGTGGMSYEPYTRRSNMCPSNTACFDFRVEVDDELLLKLYHEWLEIGPDYFGDFYPLTDYNLSQEQWLAWQFHRPETDEGFVQAFRREQCIYKSAELKLRGLDPDAIYMLKNFDVKGSKRVTGKKLMERGITVEIPQTPGAATIKYSIVK